MSSTLVETVSINYEDFSDSFLTCGTCLCMYNNEERSPKLLSCSHTVCQSCLEHIIDAQTQNTTTFRCPICRETISMPHGGVASFPPSFIVNQLLDLMGRQRRDVIPKCAQHSQTELKFCESCDVVFCVDCTGGSHNGGGASTHTIIPFSIAIKRMSEILLYKASMCMKNLDSAIDIVSDEINKLDDSAERCVEAVVNVFQDVTNIVEQRKMEVVQMVKKIRDEKKQVLSKQLDIVESEKRRVQVDCQGLQHQVEVRNITAKIGDFNEKLDVSATLTEPRENAFMQFEYRHNTAMADIFGALSRFGKISISKTFPALCKATEIKTATIHLKSVVTVMTVDYHGNAKMNGGDPLVTKMSSITGDEIPVDLTDNNNGLYTLSFTPKTTGQHRLSVSIFDRPIKDSPFLIDVTNHINPILKVGSSGSGVSNFKQPVSACFRDGRVFVLDTGNSRVKVFDENLRLEQNVTGQGLEQHSTTGMAFTNGGNLVLVNWRTKHVTERTLDGTVVKQFTSPEFIEPVAVTVNSHNEIIVADNGIGKLFVFSESGVCLNVVGSKGNSPGQFKLMSAIYATPNDDIIVCDHRIQMFSRSGQFICKLSASAPGKSGGTYGGVCVDKHGSYLATRSEKGRCIVQVFSSLRQWLFDIDSHEDRLKRPSGLVTNYNGHVYVVDLGNDCVKKFHYM